jgi:hypothetical protein
MCINEHLEPVTVLAAIVADDDAALLLAYIGVSITVAVSFSVSAIGFAACA